jgi:crotonobetainyl-CoA:carnitine CoA-transferase CaiB-like acyl-CoA transferase
MRSGRAGRHGDKVAQAQPLDVELLSCLRVVECSTATSAATALLADLGADVIRVAAPVAAGRPPSGRGIGLDLGNEAGRSTFLELVEVADAVVDARRPGDLRNLGLGYARLRRANPRIVLLSVTGGTANPLPCTAVLLAGILRAQQAGVGCHLEVTRSGVVRAGAPRRSASRSPAAEAPDETILREVLGYNTEGIKELRRSGALGSL